MWTGFEVWRVCPTNGNSQMTESDCFIVHSKTQFEFEGKQSMMQDGLLRSANVEIRRKQKSNSAEVEIVFDQAYE